MMIGKQYKAHKSNVIDIFNSYIEKKGNTDDGVNDKFLESRVRSLENGKFTLAVAGEVKAGKSTFLNALLGAEILPSDVLQSSSAIVEIFKSDTSFLKVKFADGHEESLYDDPSTPDVDEANERLHEICKIHDEFRDIPTTLIDNWIIESDGNLSVNDTFLNQLEKKSGEDDLHGKQDVVTQYIAERKKDKIPVEIEFGYPLKWEFDELRIVDSPGVNAIGGVQDVSFRFFEEANAILFVHQIKPIESESFRKFVGSVISNRSKETLFLILTHAGLYADGEIERLHAEAKRLYKNIIPENRILVVDSLLKLIHSDLCNGLSETDIKNENKQDILYKYLARAKKQDKDLIDVVLASSRFEEMFSAIDEFAMKAPNLQLQEILEQIKKGYEDQEIQYAERAGRLEKKKRNPQEFEEEIYRINRALEKYKLLTKETKEDLTANYSGVHSSWQQDIAALKVKYPALITVSDSIERTRKNMVDGLNAVQEKVDEFSKDLTKRLRETLDQIDKDFSAENRITIPKVDLNALEQEAKKSAYKVEDVGHWRKHNILKFWKWGNRNYYVKTGTKIVLDEKKLLGEYKTNCNTEFYKIVNDLPNKSKEVLNTYLDLFGKEMDSVIDDRQGALKKEKDKKQSNVEVVFEIEKLKEKKEDIQPEKKRCDEILGDLA